MSQKKKIFVKGEKKNLKAGILQVLKLAGKQQACKLGRFVKAAGFGTPVG